MNKFTYIHKLIRHGVILASAAAIAVVILGLAVLFHVTAPAFWILVCAFASGVVFCGVMLLRDIALVIAETLIPMP